MADAGADAGALGPPQQLTVGCGCSASDDSLAWSAFALLALGDAPPPPKAVNTW